MEPVHVSFGAHPIDRSTPKAIRDKIRRLKGGEARLRVLDLFAGCGGMSLGFKSAGYEIAAALEFDPDAAKSHGLNFHPGRPEHAVARDITKTRPAELTKALLLGDDPALPFDVIIGGPPCQAFARVGRSKLREVAEHPEAFRHDQRARLYIEYLEYVSECAPLAVVMENVPDMLNHGGHNLASEICEVLTARGYVCGYTLLNASFYGVPQMRERMILIAIRHELARTVSFPKPTHWIALPSGYDGSRAVALKLLNRGQGQDPNYRPPVEAKKGLVPAITVAEAVGDLPAIDARTALADGSLKRGARRFDQPIAYDGADRLSAYGKRMRAWPGFEGGGTFKDHVIRYLPRDYPLFARMKAGDEYPEALAEAERMFEEALKGLATEGKRPRKGSVRWKALRAGIVPPYSPGKFPNKWRKLAGDEPSRTLLAHLGKDGYSHIHHDSSQARTISVREAARLQSFPDGFVFSGTMNPAFRQIGNAVPPLLAKAVATSLLEQLLRNVQPARKQSAEEQRA
ncbi:MAG: DNA cytosine methyltransferase [Brevundimonas sp.]|uniref:DNA cytosine methyltransferase n=1 Tax=Brevundimonas sp. TaxID=1871086 RepID=UPI003918EC1E